MIVESDEEDGISGEKTIAMKKRRRVFDDDEEEAKIGGGNINIAPCTAVQSKGTVQLN